MTEDEAKKNQQLAIQVSETARTILKDLLEINGGVGNLAPQRLTDALMTGILGLFIGKFEEALVNLIPTKIAPPGIPNLNKVLGDVGAKIVSPVIPVKTEKEKSNA